MARERLWSRGVIRDSFLTMDRGATVLYRRASTKNPLRVGPFYIVFDPVKGALLRLTDPVFIDTVRPRETLEPEPSSRIEKLYRVWMKSHPMPARHSPTAL